ncbi:hypothetical protein Tco_1508183 [Tanacetum coccineum]
MNMDFPGLKQPNDAQVRSFASNKGHPTSSTKQVYALVANGDVALKVARNNGEQDKVNRILLSDVDLITVEDASIMVLVKVKEVDSISSMYRICRNEGFDDVKIHYVRGLWVWIQFNNAKTYIGRLLVAVSYRSGGRLKRVWGRLRYEGRLYYRIPKIRSAFNVSEDTLNHFKVRGFGSLLEAGTKADTKHDIGPTCR